MKRLALALMVLLFASVASATDADGWYSNPDCTGRTTRALYPEMVAYFCVTDAATLNSFSNVLKTEGFIVFVTRIGDINQSAGGTGEVKVFETTLAGGTAVTSSTGLDQRGADVDGDGVEDTVSLNGAVSRGAINGFTAAGLTFQITTLPASGEQMVIAVTGVK